jgi:hypothetical protein
VTLDCAASRAAIAAKVGFLATTCPHPPSKNTSAARTTLAKRAGSHYLRPGAAAGAFIDVTPPRFVVCAIRGEGCSTTR